MKKNQALDISLTILWIVGGILVGYGIAAIFIYSESLFFILIFVVAVILIIVCSILTVYRNKPEYFMSKTKLLVTASLYFDELRYEASVDKMDLESFEERSFITINHTKTLEDAKEAIKMFCFVDRNWDRIIKTINSKPDVWETLKPEKPEIISLVNDKEASGVIYVTNVLFGKQYDKVAVSSSLLGGQILPFNNNSKVYDFGDDKPLYYLRYSLLTSSSMIVMDENKDKTAVIKMDSNLNMDLINNNTDLFIEDNGSVIFVYDKSYVDSLNSDEKIDPEKSIASIEWDIIDEDDEHGIARIEFYEDINDKNYELIHLLAASTFLIFRRKQEENRLIRATVARPKVIRMHK